jgi:signal transduction histidine kinase
LQNDAENYNIFSTLVQTFNAFIKSADRLSSVYSQLAKSSTENDHSDPDEHKQDFDTQDYVAMMTKAMSDIIMNIVHRMRSPLGAIQLFTEILKGDLEDDKQDIVDEILASVHSLDAVLSNLFSAVQPITPCMQKLDFITVLEESLAFASLAIKQQNIMLERNYSQEQIYCCGDLEQLKQICFNIVLNAIQAMPDGGRLRVGVSYSDGTEYINVEIEDSGCGIPKELMDRVFTPFFTTKEGGTGLGLYVVYRIIQANKGMINIKSIQEVGTKVSIKLPS